MNITKDSVASFHYTLKDDDGNTIDTSEGQEPLPYLHGAGNIVPGLERELEGKVIGDKVSVIVKPVDGYGELNETLKQELPKSMFAGIDDIEAGMDFQAETDNGQEMVTVTNVEGDTVTIDGNHPLAGKNLHFDVEVTEVREASSEELEHGHVHGPGGHEH
jgi:FKBP-type peptidyl-prolyl cis-trans isomerase SlyD